MSEEIANALEAQATALESQAAVLRALAKGMRASAPTSEVEFMTVADAAKRFGAKPTTIRRAAKDGDVESRRVGRDLLVRVASVAAWLESQTTAARPVLAPVAEPEDEDDAALRRAMQRRTAA